MAKFNRWHVAYLEELFDADIDAFFVDSDYHHWGDLNLRPGESREWDYDGRVHFKVTRRGTRTLRPPTRDEPECAKNLPFRTRIRLLLSGQRIDCDLEGPHSHANDGSVIPTVTPEQ